MEDNSEYHIHTQKKKWFKKFLVILIVFFIIIPFSLFFAYFFISGPAEDFPVGEVLDIKKGMSVLEIANFLEKEKYIKSASVFELYDKYKTWGDENNTGIKAGKYIFKNELDIFGVYNRLKKGISGIDDISIIISEGEANFSIAEKFSKNNKFKNFSEKRFLDLAKEKEGYLYPDTYSFSPYVTEETIIKSMEDNFQKKVGSLVEKIEKSNKSLDKIIIMASLIEKEASGYPKSVKRKISGILWRRLEIGMPLQVDAVFSYIYKKHLYKTLFKDLEVDSPYNTYKYKGLPPGPIGNPTFSSIEAAMYPTPTKDLFYITGKDGKFYYAKTGEVHYQNIDKYRTNYIAPPKEEEKGVEENLDSEKIKI